MALNHCSVCGNAPESVREMTRKLLSHEIKWSEIVKQMHGAVDKSEEDEIRPCPGVAVPKWTRILGTLEI